MQKFKGHSMRLQYKKSQRLFSVFFVVVFAIVFSQAFHNSFLCAEGIDIVYTWVDGGDAKWQEIRNKYFDEHRPFLVHVDANTKNRYRNRDELKYSLRSLNLYAPFINHIYIVTFGQRPKWLKDDPRITIVDHQEIFLNREDLPTFNSHAIEANLHRIPNLSEKFIYFNDDVFLGAPVNISDFFTENGQICVNQDIYRVPTGPVMPDEVAYDSAWRNTDALLTLYFKKGKRYKLAHAPFALTKSILQEVETRFPHVFQLVSTHRFRMPSDFTMTNGLIPYYAIYTKKAKLTKTPALMVRIGPNVEKNAKRFEKIRKNTYKFFCMEDVAVEDNDAADCQLHEFFESYFPQIASWEEEYSTPLQESSRRSAVDANTANTNTANTSTAVHTNKDETLDTALGNLETNVQSTKVDRMLPLRRF